MRSSELVGAILSALVAVACGGSIQGSGVAAVPAIGPPAATVTTSQPDGLRVLANTTAAKQGEPALLATSATELAALWSDVGLAESRPARSGHAGPLAVRRRGHAIDLVILLGGGAVTPAP